MERHSDQLSRVRGMAAGAATWDLSDNDTAALATLLNDRAMLLYALKELVRATEGADNCADMGVGTDRDEMIAARKAIMKAEER